MGKTPFGSENLYDSLPYNTKSTSYTHPGHIAAVATLLGLDPVPVDRCRVLELGCGTGVNLIGMAIHLSDSQFVGIDASPVQIDVGRQWLDSLGVTNVELRDADITSLGAELGTFDYIICHGVFSWVAEPVQARILELYNELLSPRGLGIISYNCKPGWALPFALRHLMLMDDDHSLTPEERIDNAVSALKVVARRAEAKKNNLYATMLAAVMKTFNDLDRTYFFHEYLEEHNAPVYIDEFAERLREGGLRMLGELHTAGLREGMVRFDDPVPDDATLIRQLVEDDIVANRRFRAALVGRQDVQIDRRVQPSRLFDLSFLTEPLSESDATVDMTDDLITVIDADGGTHIFRSDTVAVIRRLLDLIPLGCHFEELYDLIGADDSGEKLTSREDLAAKLFDLFAAGVLQVHSARPQLLLEVSDKPRTLALTRLESKEGEYATNVWHRRVRLALKHRVVIQFLDGINTMAEIQDELRQLLETGQLELRDENASIDEAVSEIPSIVKELAGAGLLVG